MSRSRWFTGLWATIYGIGTANFAAEAVLNLPSNLTLGAASCVGVITCGLIAHDNLQNTLHSDTSLEPIVLRPTGNGLHDRAINVGKASLFVFGGIALGVEGVSHLSTNRLDFTFLLGLTSFNALSYAFVYAVKACRPDLFKAAPIGETYELRSG